MVLPHVAFWVAAAYGLCLRPLRDQHGSPKALCLLLPLGPGANCRRRLLAGAVMTCARQVLDGQGWLWGVAGRRLGVAEVAAGVQYAHGCLK